MALFQYVAMDTSGREQKGELEASSEQEVMSKLKADGLFPTKITEGKSGGKKKAKAKPKKGAKKKSGGGAITIGTPKIPKKKLTLFTRQLATLLAAGLPLVRSLRTLEKQAGKDLIVQGIIEDIANQVESGSTFSEALAKYPKSFSNLYVNMVRAGEASGAMETVLSRLAEFMEKAERLVRKVKGAMMYPAIVLLVAVGITYALMVFVIPQFKKMFNEMMKGEPLPQLTEYVVNVSQFLQNNVGIVVLGVIGFVTLFILFKKSKQGSFILDTVALKLPPFGGLVTKTAVSGFARTLSTLLNSGVTILQALEITRDTSSNQVVANAVQSVHDTVKDGESMAKPIEQAKIFPEMVIGMIEVGEETGALPDMLGRVADVYEDEVDTAVDGLTSMIEPLLIVFLAVVVGTIVIAMFLPLIKMIANLG